MQEQVRLIMSEIVSADLRKIIRRWEARKDDPETPAEERTTLARAIAVLQAELDRRYLIYR
jgi:hypothetical protein